MSVRARSRTTRITASAPSDNARPTVTRSATPLSPCTSARNLRSRVFLVMSSRALSTGMSLMPSLSSVSKLSASGSGAKKSRNNTRSNSIGWFRSVVPSLGDSTRTSPRRRVRSRLWSSSEKICTLAGSPSTKPAKAAKAASGSAAEERCEIIGGMIRPRSARDRSPRVAAIRPAVQPDRMATMSAGLEKPRPSSHTASLSLSSSGGASASSSSSSSPKSLCVVLAPTSARTVSSA